MIVCITEKPSVAKDIAAILGANTRRDGYFEGGDYKVTWTFGHLCTLKEPADYTPMWKKWSLGSLPMLPPKFGIKIIPEKSIEHQFRVIKSLVNQASEVINCGDAGQEGELIQRWVMQKAGVKCPVRRLWISSLTDESIRKGFADLKPESEFNNLYHAGLSRAVGDWILGMNATRLYTLKYSTPGNVLSIGRVQTPTLSLIVQRHHEIVNFVSEDFWELKTVYRDTVFNSTAGRYMKIEDAEQALSLITNKPFIVQSVTEKKGKEAPPRLFDLTSLQVECNRRWGWSADDTLKLIQSLYEKKVTTYPRVDTTYLSDDIYPKVPEILKKMTPYASLTQPVLVNKIPKSKKVFDNSKVTDHHAIIPTGESPSSLVGNERQLYHLVATRFIAAFYPDCQFLATTVVGKVDDIEFKANGKVITEPGWRNVIQSNGEKGSDDSDDKILPHFDEGESGPHDPSLQKKATQPPKYYTEGTLLRAMETAGKTVDDEELRDAMKENGIGRPSTRAAIIETLFKRRYIYRERKNIMASQAGIDLIATINQELLKSAKLTGIWENKLRRIERGEYSAAEFINELKSQINEIVINVLNDNSARRIIVEGKTEEKPVKQSSKSKKGDSAAKPPRKPRVKITSFEQIICPVCKKGHIVKGKSAFGCSNYASGCKTVFSFSEFAETLSPEQLSKAIKLKK
ncbi:MAG: DNA topoisomerase 3 [Muribaculaceae bacterium]|nr:DNA topoisomerase 3 [Muribaculaceae bacterium]